ncbi:response regulator [Roseospira marina]|uniref:Response regulator n=1 Tax=Roseospira marina TaxID=140057 RepID=A0A5M6IH34_9PROT|nr:response regulator [Roseospira marina]KAA5607069.1 response regulator [Roseospira marina]MBB4312739.1 YesN/AraC family two-component response regulator [Roseospira marina]MBB5086488.1 YesN/AraC family two-component response regulator [Roseospira marina]
MYDVVIVEDEELERQALRSILTDHVPGLNILGEAKNGAEAIELIDRYDIDLVLLDINIPKPSGLEVLQKLRDKHAQTKVIITTAYDYFDTMRAAIQLRADDYLLKPIRPSALVSAVEGCLEHLNTGKRSGDLAHEVGTLLEQSAYREAVALVRRHGEWIFMQREEAPRHLALEFATALVDLAKERNLRLPETVAQEVHNLQTLRLDDRSRHHVLGVFRSMTDALFDSVRERCGQSPERMQKALNFIERNLDKGVTLEDVAEHINVSACYLSRLFKKKMNINFIAYLTTRRIELAKELLSDSEECVTNIAFELSYSDVNYFCKSFKKEVGVSPSAYRQQCRAPTAIAAE